MFIDFHSHYPAPDSIVCTADASESTQGKALMKCAGLLPNRWTEERRQKLFELIDSKADLHMGEVGLDRRFEDILPMEKQISILREELDFAIARGRCISLHCVHATKPMLDILGALEFRPYSILWHGFSGSVETARELGRLKVLISIGPRFRAGVGELLEATPYVVPETDYEGSYEAEHLDTLRNQYLRFPEGYIERATEIFNLFSKGC